MTRSGSGSLRLYIVQRALGLSRTPGEMVRFSAKVDSFIHAGGMLKFWPSLPGEVWPRALRVALRSQP